MRWRVALAVVAGLAQSASFAWPLDDIFSRGQNLWWLQIAALVAYAVTLDKTTKASQAAYIGFSFHASSLTASLYWLHIAMATYGGLHPALAWGAVLALASGLALFGVGAALLYGMVRRRCVGAKAFAFAAAWLLSELARGQWLTGFGWAAAGYAHVDGPMALWAPWAGVYGIGFVCALWAAGFVQLMLAKKWRLTCLWLAVLMAGTTITSGGQFTRPNGTLQAVLLQGNIAQNEKFDDTTGVLSALTWYSEQLRSAQADVVLAPETAIPLLPQQLPQGYLAAAASSSDDRRTVKLVGIPLGSYSEGYTNSVIALEEDARGAPYRYDKHHLVPFGEFIPPLFKWFVRMMNIPLGDFNRGGLLQKNMLVRGERISPTICFEDLFPEELAARFGDAANSPTMFANFSNLAWFGDTSAMYQHLHISQMRSLEFERPFLRVSNTGVTSVVDHRGQLTAALPPLTRAVLTATVQGREGLTPFARWSARLGLWPLWLLGFAILWWVIASRPRSDRETPGAPQT